MDSGVSTPVSRKRCSPRSARYGSLLKRNSPGLGVKRTPTSAKKRCALPWKKSPSPAHSFNRGTPSKRLPVLNLEGDFFSELPYKAGPVLAAGASSHVVLATRTDRPEQRVAAKVMLLNTGHLSESSVRKMFLSELSVFRKTEHPGLVKCLLAARCPDSLVFTMKLYPLGDLASHVDVLPASSKARVAGQLATAVAYLHHKRIVHGDIKLDNVLMDHGFRPVLGDFGLARYVPNKGASLPAVAFGGTRQYWAPEIRGQDPLLLVDPFKVSRYATLEKEKQSTDSRVVLIFFHFCSACRLR